MNSGICSRICKASSGSARPRQNGRGHNELPLREVPISCSVFARQWQNQERTAHLIATFIEKVVPPLGVASLIGGKHMLESALALFRIPVRSPVAGSEQ